MRGKTVSVHIPFQLRKEQADVAAIEASSPEQPCGFCNARCQSFIPPHQQGKPLGTWAFVFFPNVRHSYSKTYTTLISRDGNEYRFSYSTTRSFFRLCTRLLGRFFLPTLHISRVVMYKIELQGR